MSGVSLHIEERLNGPQFFYGTQNLSVLNLHHWWMHLEFQDDDVNKAGSNSSNIGYIGTFMNS